MMIEKCIFVILAALYGLAIHFFIAKILPEFWRACIACVKYIRLVRKIDFGTLLFVFCDYFHRSCCIHHIHNRS